ncbi:unnamed protein product (macronuclear) [Paramecium tetraurelia]|uniref:t-SNARE coiled-coil homology domain-containing protein n=1 Tax=Paramecium tetraurelia TaxID=5888 RepID=A0CGX4_PARTE|nr:uncharacterized protein GSPATT00007481001 [Paramecium tetraurelia]CAK70041.1 unnamed protein product [Paramecium tetraurelia]|eukprot:XP_001437438.1 hypothetical protein (macronuclear) [Paramecium tetraurelia strain d4-2]
MSFFQDFNKVKKQQDILELQDLHQKDGEAQVAKLTQMAHARIRNFEKVYHYMNEEIINSRSLKGMDDIPVLVKEAKNDLDEMLKIIQEMQSIQLFRKTENVNNFIIDYQSQRQQTVQKLIQVFSDSNEKLKKLTDQLLSRQQTSLQSAKQSIKERQNDAQINVQLLDELQYDEEFIQRRNKQINEIAQVVYQLNQMMAEGAEMIKNQGLKIDIISSNVKSAKEKVDGACVEVKKASQVQQGNNGRMQYLYLSEFRLFFCGIITLIVVIIVLLFSAGSRPHTDPNPQQPQTQN